MLGPPEETMVLMLQRDTAIDAYGGSVEAQLLRNVAEMMAANNEAILFALKED